MTDIDLLVEHQKRTDRFLAAKEAAASGTPKALAVWRKEKEAMRAWREFWRSLRSPSDGTASPDVVGLKAGGE